MPGVSDLPDHIGYLLRAASNAVSHAFARKLADEGVTVAEWVVMRSLFGTDAIAPSVLADRIGLTKGAISKLAGRLLEKGLIERTGNSRDKRGHSLSLSAVGEEKVPYLARLADENDAAFFAVLTGEEREILRTLLHKLIDKHELSDMPVN